MRKIFLSGVWVLFSFAGYSQETTSSSQEERIKTLESKMDKWGQLKLSGYVQTQWTWDESDIESGNQNDFSVRRGRIKAAYTNQYGEAVIQLDATENGVDVKDAYLKIKQPAMDWVSLCAGIFNRPFGDEIAYSSSRRETPERSRIFQTLFPKERDLGVGLAFRGPESTILNNLTLHIGLFTGNGGQAKETDSRKDFIGRLAYQKKSDNISWGFGTSLYAGGVRLAGDDNQKAYKVKNKKFIQDNFTHGDYARRRYYGFDGQFSVVSGLGKTSLRAEYLWGTQPGASEGSKSPTNAIVSDIYIRNFRGGYLYFIQDIGKSKHSFVARYDAYDPNTKLSKDECPTTGDISYSTWGVGWLYRLNTNCRLMCYYEMNNNEKTANSLVPEKYARNLPDDVFTLRLQYKF